MNIGRAIFAGAIGGVAWIAGLLAFFGPAQTVLGNPAYQNEKFIATFTEPPVPILNTQPGLIIAGIIVIGIIYGLVFAWIIDGLPGRNWRKGSAFGVVAWALSFTWFEFFLPWNVMHEPVALVLLELVLWFIVMQCVGIAIALAYGREKRAAKQHAA